jgi:hypothetical protein
MGKQFSMNIETELLQAKQRRGHGFSEGSYYETMGRLATLANLLKQIGSDAFPEFFRHFPVATIAALETHFKVLVCTVVDSGSVYLQRGLTLAKERLMSAADVLALLERRNVTAGDLVSHLLPFNSIASIEKPLTVLFDEDFKSLVGKAVDPNLARSPTQKPDAIVQDVPALWAALSKTFEQRHILAHESATQYLITYEDADSAIASVAALAKATDAILWATIWKDRPLTQYDRNVEAFKKANEAQKILFALTKRSLRIAKENGELDRFREMYSVWRQYYDQWSSWQNETFSMGSIAPRIRATTLDLAVRCLVRQLAMWIGNMRPDEPPIPDIAI